VLSELYRAHPPSEVAFVGVSVDDSREDAEKARAEWGIPYPVALDDGTVSRGYQVSLLPTVILIDREGKIRSSHAGVPSRGELERFIRGR
jgi:peroxiredoxin